MSLTVVVSRLGFVIYLEINMPVNLALYAGILHSEENMFFKKLHLQEWIKALAQPVQPWWSLTENISTLLLYFGPNEPF